MHTKVAFYFYFLLLNHFFSDIFSFIEPRTFSITINLFIATKTIHTNCFLTISIQLDVKTKKSEDPLDTIIKLDNDSELGSFNLKRGYTENSNRTIQFK